MNVTPQSSVLSPQSSVSVIIVNWNTAALLCQCLTSLYAHAVSRPEVIVVDNGSTDGSAQMVARSFPQVRLIRNMENRGFAAANNQGLALAMGRHLLLLNSDTVLATALPAALSRFLDETPDAGAAGPRLVGADGGPQPFTFGGDPTLGYLLRRGARALLRRGPLHDWAESTSRAVDWVSGACLMVRREVYEQVGGLDEKLFMYFEDNDWCLRIRKAGWRVHRVPTITLTHLGGQSATHNPGASAAYYQSLLHFYRKHYSPVELYMLRIALVGYGLLRRIPGLGRQV